MAATPPPLHRSQQECRNPGWHGPETVAVRDDDGHGRREGYGVTAFMLISRLGLALYLGTRGTAKLAVRPATPMVFAVGAMELGAGILLGLGLFMPLAGMLVVAVAANLVLVNWPNEYPLYLLFVAIAIALASPGAYSLDSLLSLDGIGAGWASHGVAAGLAAAAATDAARRLNRQRTAGFAMEATPARGHHARVAVVNGLPLTSPSRVHERATSVSTSANDLSRPAA